MLDLCHGEMLLNLEGKRWVNELFRAFILISIYRGSDYEYLFKENDTIYILLSFKTIKRAVCNLSIKRILSLFLYQGFVE